MKRSLWCLTLALLFHFAQAQEKWPNSWVQWYFDNLNEKNRAPGEASFLVYPTFAYAPETSWEIGLSSLYLYYANQDTSNRLSEINGFTFFTLENQYGLWFDHANYSDQDRWMFLGRLRYQSFPLLYHGIGPKTPVDPIARVDANFLLWRERILRRIDGDLYGGLNIDVQHLSRTNFETLDDIPRPTLPRGATGSFNAGVGLALVYDTRHNVLNVRDGLYSEWGFLHYNPGLGSNFRFTSFITDTRIFRKVNKRDVIAAQFFGQFTQGNVPFNMLPLMGGENLMRGYYLGRYRDKNYMATQIEYRLLPFGFSKRWGAAVFAATGSVFGAFDEWKARNLLGAAGGGVRFLLFPKKDIYTRLEVAFTREGPGYYFFIGEAF